MMDWHLLGHDLLGLLKTLGVIVIVGALLLRILRNKFTIETPFGLLRMSDTVKHNRRSTDLPDEPIPQRQPQEISVLDVSQLKSALADHCQIQHDRIMSRTKDELRSAVSEGLGEMHEKVNKLAGDFREFKGEIRQFKADTVKHLGEINGQLAEQVANEVARRLKQKD